MSHRHVCVHAHFDPPPLENPWLGEIERDDSAFPFRDAVERAVEECYGPLALGVRADDEGRTAAYNSALGRMSFDFSPGLLAWLERKRPSLYRRVLDADRTGAGPGNALARPYFHAALPTLSRRDKTTLARWGLADFKARFARAAEGFCLPESAADDETLDVLAREGVRFVVLSPERASASRALGGIWREETAGTLDPKTPYRWTSPADEKVSLAVFFHHDRLSRGVADGETTATVDAFVRGVEARLLPGDVAQAVHVCSDGESYGLKRPGAERILPAALEALAGEGIEPIGHARFLELFPPPHEVQVRPWTQDAGEWRAPLREALERLARRLDAFFEDEASRFFNDPWAARDAAIAWWLDRAPDAGERFLAANAKRALTEHEKTRALRLLSLQRELLSMFDSRGWTAGDVSDAGTVGVLRRAARAVDVARSLGEDAEAALVERLATITSRNQDLADGAGVYRKLVLPSRAGLDRAAAHAALLDHLRLAASGRLETFLFELGPAVDAVKMGLAGRDRSLSVRPVTVVRPDTGERESSNVIVHRADRMDFACWAAPPGAFDAAALGAEFLALNDDEFRTLLDRRFGPSRFGLDALFPDDRAEVVKTLVPAASLGAERAAFLKAWTESVMAARRGGRQDDAILEMLELAPARGFLASDLPWARGLEEDLHVRLEEALAGGGAEISRALRWLDVLWACGLVAGRWRLRDFHERWTRKLSSAGDSAAKDACRALGERLGLAESLLENPTW